MFIMPSLQILWVLQSKNAIDLCNYDQQNVLL